MVSGLSPETGCRKYIQAGVVKDTSSAISKSDLLASILLLLVRKSDLLASISLLLVRKSDLLASISLLLARKRDLLVSISLLLVRKRDLLVSISLLLVRKSDLLVSILLLLVSKSDFLVADEVASFSRDLSTLRRTPAWPSATVPRPSHSKRNNFLKSFRKDVFSDPSRVSYG